MLYFKAPLQVAKQNFSVESLLTFHNLVSSRRSDQIRSLRAQLEIHPASSRYIMICFHYLQKLPDKHAL